jgi:hypothetical protein
MPEPREELDQRDHPRTEPRDAWRTDARVALLPWLLSRLVVAAALFGARHLFDDLGRLPRPIQLGQGLFAWDGAFYRHIAEDGYREVGRASLRFFPLVPMLAEGLGAVMFGHTAAALLVLVNVAAFLFLASLHRLVARETGDAATASRAVWFAALFPLASVLVLGYAESIAMLLAVWMFMALRRGNFWWAALAGVGAGLCRPVGVLLVVPAAIEGWRGFDHAAVRDRIARIAAVVSPVAGVVAFLAWVGVEFGNAWLPVSEQNKATLRGGFQDPFTRTIDGISDAFHHHFSSVVHLAWAAGFVVLLVVVARKLPASYTWYCGATLLVALSAKNLDSLERYVMSSFPFVIGLAILAKRKDMERTVLVLAALGMAGYATVFFLGIGAP